jgi:hypothetical protein
MTPTTQSKRCTHRLPYLPETHPHSRCKAWAVRGTNFCWQHSRSALPMTPTTQSKRCMHRLPYLPETHPHSQCKAWAVRGTNFCWQHSPKTPRCAVLDCQSRVGRNGGRCRHHKDKDWKRPPPEFDKEATERARELARCFSRVVVLRPEEVFRSEQPPDPNQPVQRSPDDPPRWVTVYDPERTCCASRIVVRCTDGVMRQAGHAELAWRPPNKEETS